MKRMKVIERKSITRIYEELKKRRLRNDITKQIIKKINQKFNERITINAYIWITSKC